jgi:molybdopterin molybdotransferase
MASFEEARQWIVDAVAPLGAVEEPLLDALGQVIAEPIVAPRDMPLCNNSAMDGYAVRSADCRQPAELRIVGFLPAGSSQRFAVEPGCAVKIMTGALIPDGCDAVARLEDAEETQGRVVIRRPVEAGEHVRFAGEDFRCGEVVLAAGTVLGPAETSILASCGRVSVSTFRGPRVAILSTGDELVEPGEPALPGKVVNSNGLALAAAVKACGALPLLLGIARDARDSHLEKMREGLQADVLITSAGVSAGARDLVRSVLAELGMKQVFQRVAMSPASPTCFGLVGAKPVFCLPGNPVAALIAFALLVRPALLKIMGHSHVLDTFVTATLQETVKKKPGKVQILRVTLTCRDGRYWAIRAGDQNTGILKTLLHADGLAILPMERTMVSSGDEVSVQVLRRTAAGSST